MVTRNVKIHHHPFAEFLKKMSGNETPSLSRNETPSLSGKETPSLSGNETPSLSGNETPSLSGNETPSFITHIDGSGNAGFSPRALQCTVWLAAQSGLYLLGKGTAVPGGNLDGVGSTHLLGHLQTPFINVCGKAGMPMLVNKLLQNSCPNP